MINYLDSMVKKPKVFFDYDISKECSMGVGGRVSAFISADNFRELSEVYLLAAKNKTRFIIMGAGTNIVFNGGFLDMIVVKLGKGFSGIGIREAEIEAGAGLSLQKFVVEAARNGYDLSTLAGIPGTLGGAVCGNSGDICRSVVSIDCMTEKGGREAVELSREDFGYRHLNINGIKAILSIRFRAPKGDRDVLFNKVRDRIKQKKAAQPTQEKSAGCFFKNPYGHSAGELIQACGFKGFKYGEAGVSKKHANFIINLGRATAEDIYVLSRIIYDKVYSHYNIKLENEVRMIGF